MADDQPASRDEVRAGSGRDRVSVRDGRPDVVRCGKGRDTAIADRKDKLRGCERQRIRAARR